MGLAAERVVSFLGFVKTHPRIWFPLSGIGIVLSGFPIAFLRDDVHWVPVMAACGGLFGILGFFMWAGCEPDADKVARADSKKKEEEAIRSLQERGEDESQVQQT